MFVQPGDACAIPLPTVAGPSTSFTSFDGAIFEPLTSQLYSDFCIAVDRESTAVDADPTLMKLCCWFVRTPCILHGVHTAMKWGMQHELGDKQFSKEVWGCVAGLRSSYGSLEPFLTMWITSRLVFREAGAGELPDALWCLLGLTPSLCDEVDTLKLRFVDGSLIVSCEHQDSDTVSDEVRMVCLQAFRVFEWSDSRWLGASRSSREMLLAIVLGVEDFVEFAIARGHSTWHLRSFRKLNVRMQEFFLQAAVGSYPSDSCMDVLLKDDRFLLVLDRVLAELREEVDFALALGSDVWEALAAVVAVPANRLRSKSVDVAVRSAAFETVRRSLAAMV